MIKDEVVVRKCSKCGRNVVGLVHDGFLWPIWMKKKGVWKYPPHGPRLYNLEKEECWYCSILSGEDWHR